MLPLSTRPLFSLVKTGFFNPVQADEYPHNAAYNLLDAARGVGVQHERQDRRRLAPLGARQTVRRRRRQVHQRAGNFRYPTVVRGRIRNFWSDPDTKINV
jgi:hypothetical protein